VSPVGGRANEAEARAAEDVAAFVPVPVAYGALKPRGSGLQIAAGGEPIDAPVDDYEPGARPADSGGDVRTGCAAPLCRSASPPALNVPPARSARPVSTRRPPDATGNISGVNSAMTLPQGGWDKAVHPVLQRIRGQDGADHHAHHPEESVQPALFDMPTRSVMPCYEQGDQTAEMR